MINGIEAIAVKERNALFAIWFSLSNSEMVTSLSMTAFLWWHASVDGGTRMNWKQLVARIKSGFQRFMYGRNGVDQLTFLVLIISAVITFVAAVFRLPWLQFFYYAGVFLAFYRTLSRNLLKRRQENQLFLQKSRSVKSWFRVQQRIVSERKTHRHFKCPACKQRLRVPKGKGSIKVTCSKCGEQFSKKS